MCSCKDVVALCLWVNAILSVKNLRCNLAKEGDHMKRFLQILLSVSLLFSVLEVPAFAGQWVNGTIVQVGMNGVAGWISVTATDGAFPDTRSYIFPQSYFNSFLATALTAQSSGKSLDIFVDSITSGSACTALAVR